MKLHSITLITPIICSLFVITMTSCVSNEDINRGKQAFVGKPIKEAISYFGYPDNEKNIAGDKVYIWTNAYSQNLVLPNNTTTTGYVGGQYINATTYGTQVRQSNHQCILIMATSLDNTIKHVDYKGSLGACEKYMRMLAAYGETTGSAPNVSE